MLVLEQNLDDLAKINPLASIDRQDIRVNFCLLDNFMDIRALLYQFEAFFPFLVNQNLFVVEDFVAFRTVTNKGMVGVHLRP